MNIAFYISGNASRLDKILSSMDSHLINATKFVFSDDEKNRHLMNKLKNIGISYFLKDYDTLSESIDDKNLYISDCLLEKLLENKIDYCFSFGNHMLKGEILTVYKNKIINFHPSLLPFFPGRNAIDQAREANVAWLGNTAHFIDAGMDTGPIIMQSVQHISTFEKYGYDAILDTQVDMFFKISRLLKEDKINILDDRVLIRGTDYSGRIYLPNND